MMFAKAGNTTAVDVVLQHASVKTDQKLVCSIAMVCKGWRTSVQQSHTGAMTIRLQALKPSDGEGYKCDAIEQFVSFALWLQRYGSLVSSMQIHASLFCNYSWGGMGDRWLKNVAGALLSTSLRAAAANVAAGCRAGTQSFQLRSYSSDMLHSVAVLQALPAATLTRLELTEFCPAAVTSAITRLSNLRDLQLKASLSHPRSVSTADACVPALKQLQQLTSLGISNTGMFDATQLPVQLQHLTVEYIFKGEQRRVIDLVHLTHLTSLQLSYKVSIHQGSRLPRQLIDLCIRQLFGTHHVSATHSFALTQLQQLRQLYIEDVQETPQELLQLGALPQRQKLSLRYNDAASVLRTATSWPRVQQLQRLEIMGVQSRDALQAVVSHLAGLTRLTGLWLHPDHINSTGHVLVLDGLCASTARLQKLKALGLSLQLPDSGHDIRVGDIQQLSVLTQLTSLYLDPMHGHEYVTDTDIVVLALELKQLQTLVAPVKSVAVLPVIGKLRELRHLHIEGLPDAEQATGLQYLVGLKKLTALIGLHECSKEELDSFWAALRA